MGRVKGNLSKRCLRGNDILMKVLITVGSTNFKFDRLFETVDELIEEGVLQGDLVTAQTGVTDYKIKNYNHFEFATNEEMASFMEDATVIICHAGTGTVTGALSKGKKVIVFPRLKKFNEHESDNQLELATAFKEVGYVEFATDKEGLKSAIERINDFEPKKFISNNQNFLSILREVLAK